MWILIVGGQQGVPNPRFPSPLPPTFLPLCLHFPPPIKFFHPPDKNVLFQELKRIYISQEPKSIITIVNHRLSWFLHAKKSKKQTITRYLECLFLSQQKIRNTISVSNDLDPDEDRQNPDQDRLIWVQTVCIVYQQTTSVLIYGG